MNLGRKGKRMNQSDVKVLENAHTFGEKARVSWRKASANNDCWWEIYRETGYTPNAECAASLFQHKPSLFPDAPRLSSCIGERMTIGGTHHDRFVHLHVGGCLSCHFVAKA
jgi:hypothetical protein